MSAVDLVHADAMHDAAISCLLDMVSKQAEDEGLWFIAETASEAYLQQELRKLHAAIELVGELADDEAVA